MAHWGRWSALLGFAAAVGVHLGTAAPAGAQTALGNEAALREQYGKNFSRFNELVNGKKATAADKGVGENMARYWVYRFTWKDTYTVKDPSIAPFNEIKRLGDQLKQAGDNPAATKDFMAVFSQEFIKCVKEAQQKLSFDDHVTRQYHVNIALLLPAVARCKHDDIADFLAEVAADPKQHDVYRFCAVKGLREFFPLRLPRPDDNLDDKIQARMDRELKRAKAVISYLNRPWPTGDREVTDAAHFQRREAIRTLALAQAPLLGLHRDAGGQVTKSEAPVLVVLLRVLAPAKGKGALTPPPSLSERCEAAIGVCQLRANQLEGYNSEVAVYLVGKLVVDYAEGYKADYQRIGDKKIPLLPWKVTTERLEQALSDFQKFLPKETDGQRKALEGLKEVIAKAGPLFRPMKLHQAAEDPAALAQIVDGLRPAASVVVAGVPETQLQLK